ncbi:MAG TPA: aminotransferase class IV [Gemmatimonadaceae bacterium]
MYDAIGAGRYLHDQLPIAGTRIQPRRARQNVAVTPSMEIGFQVTHSRRVHAVLAYLNGQYLPRSAAMVPVDDRGFVFGDGVYEVWRVVSGRLFETERHLQRLRYGLNEIRIAAPDIACGDVLARVAGRLLRESGLAEGEATFYLEITRGAAPRTHNFPPASTKPTVFATVNRFNPADDLRRTGARVITVPDVRWMRCDIKSVQLLPNVLAKQQAAEAGAVDALMIRDGMITESSHANVLAVLDGAIRTHPANNLILRGITRQIVLEIAREIGVAVHEHAFSERDLPRLEELFLVGTTTDVTPVVRVDDAAIGSGAPGPIAKRLFTELRARIDAACSARLESDFAPAPA